MISAAFWAKNQAGGSTTSTANPRRKIGPRGAPGAPVRPIRGGPWPKLGRNPQFLPVRSGGIRARTSRPSSPGGATPERKSPLGGIQGSGRCRPLQPGIS